MAATRFRLTVDLTRAVAAVSAGVSVPAGPYRALLQMPAEVWLDTAGLIRRVAVSVEPTAADDAQIWAIAELWDFGVAANMTPLRTDEVAAPGDLDWTVREPGSWHGDHARQPE